MPVEASSTTHRPLTGVQAGALVLLSLAIAFLLTGVTSGFSFLVPVVAGFRVQSAPLALRLPVVLLGFVGTYGALIGPAMITH